MKSYDIMMVKNIDDKYIVKSHLGEIKEYTIFNLPKYILNWINKKTMSYDRDGNCCWM